MNRVLAAVAVLEAVVIAWLLLAREDSKLPATTPVPAAAGADAREEPPAPPAAAPAAENSDPKEAADATVGPALGTVLYGRVLAADGSPATGGWISLVDGNGKTSSIRPDGEGRFAQAGIAAGSYDVRLQFAEYEPLETELVVPAGTEALRRDFTLARAVVLAIRFVTPEGEPLMPRLTEDLKGRSRALFGVMRGLTAVATREPPGPRLGPTLLAAHTRSAAGEYRPVNSFGPAGKNEDGRSGTLTVRGELPVYVSACLRSEVLATVTVTEAAESLNLVVDPALVADSLAGVTFRIACDGDASLLDKIRCDLSDRQSGGLTPFERDGDRVTIRDAVPGRLQLTVGAGAELESYRRNVDLPPGEIVDLGTIRLGRRVILEGRVVDADGEPVAGASVFAYALDRPWSEQQNSPMSVRTDAKGSFTDRLGAHRYYVTAAVRDGGLGTAEVDLSAGAPDDFTIRIPAPATVAIAMADTVPIGTEVRIEDGAGRVVWGLDVTIPWPRAAGIPPGSWFLVVTRPGAAPERRPFPAKAGQTTELSIE